MGQKFRHHKKKSITLEALDIFSKNPFKSVRNSIEISYYMDPWIWIQKWIQIRGFKIPKVWNGIDWAAFLVLIYPSRHHAKFQVKTPMGRTPSRISFFYYISQKAKKMNFRKMTIFLKSFMIFFHICVLLVTRNLYTHILSCFEQNKMVPHMPQNVQNGHLGHYW